MARKMGFERARQLLSRAEFAPSYTQLAAAAQSGEERVIDALLAAPAAPTTAPPGFVKEPAVSGRDSASRLLRQEQASELSQWWHAELIGTAHPLREKMVLFWHNHFVTSMASVRSPLMMYNQNALFRTHALGNFRALLEGVVRDPAMLMYLNNNSNRRREPNENFARELLELFTLGQGHYTERDIKECARAFTGWSVQARTASFKLRARQHDPGAKTVLGTTGTLDGQDVVNILLDHPQTALHITQKLWRAFINQTPDADEVARLASIWRKASYELKPLLRALFLSPFFLDRATIGAQIKSPVELIIGTVRLFDFKLDSVLPVLAISRRMGQQLFYPPNVKGWEGGKRWINADTLLYRQQTLERLFRTPDNFPDMETRGWEKMLGARAAKDKKTRAARLIKTVLPLTPIHPVDPSLDADAFELIRHLVADPTYQLC